jgi:hypothetical protein
MKQKAKRDKADPRNYYIWSKREINKRACRNGDPRKGGHRGS